MGGGGSKPPPTPAPALLPAAGPGEENDDIGGAHVIDRVDVIHITSAGLSLVTVFLLLVVAACLYRCCLCDVKNAFRTRLSHHHEPTLPVHYSLLQRANSPAPTHSAASFPPPPPPPPPPPIYNPAPYSPAPFFHYPAIAPPQHQPLALQLQSHPLFARSQQGSSSPGHTRGSLDP
jgi:hypothetical protein